MKIKLTFEKPRSSTWFQPKDEVRGRLEIHGARFRQPPRIFVKFRGQPNSVLPPLTVELLRITTNITEAKISDAGILKTTLRPKANDSIQSSNYAGPKNTELTLFNESKDLSLESQLLSSGCTDFNQTYFLPFAFTFPPCCTSCTHPPTEGASCQLPPSLDISASGLRVKARYLIIGIVERPGLLHWATKVKQMVPFSPLPPEVVLPTSNLGLLPANHLIEHCQEREMHTILPGFSTFATEPLPQYSPTLQLELLLPGPPVLTLGSSVRPRLMFHIPLELLNGRNLYVRSATVQLRSTMTAKLGSATRTSVRARHVCSARGLVVLDEENFQLDMGSWSDCLVLDVQPSFHSCGLDLEYTLEVVAGISLGRSEEVQSVQASLGVIISSPPPAYETEDNLAGGSGS